MPTQVSEQFRSKSTFSASFRNNKQNNYSTTVTQLDHRSNYRKGEMMNDILMDSQNYGKKQSKGGSINFKFDRHLSKQGSSNLQRYYKLKDTINAKSQRLLQMNQQMNLCNTANQWSKQNDLSHLMVKDKNVAGMISIVDQNRYKLASENHNQTISQAKLIPLKNQAEKEKTNTQAQISSRDYDYQNQQIFNLMTSAFGQFSKNKKLKQTQKKQGPYLKKEKNANSKRFEPIIQVEQIQDPKQMIVTQRERSNSPRIQIQKSQSPNQDMAYATDFSDNISQKKLKKRKLRKKSNSSQIKQIKQQLERSSKINESKESIDVQLNTNQNEESILAINNHINNSDEKLFYRTEDGQLQQADSDDDYTIIQRQIQQLNYQSQSSLNNTSDQVKQIIPKKFIEPKQEYGFVDSQHLTSLKLSHDFQHSQNQDPINKAKKMLANLKHVHRFESQSTFKSAIDAVNQPSTQNRLASKNLQIFKLATQMSKQVKSSNKSLNRLMNTLNTAQQSFEGERQEKGITGSELRNISQADTATLLKDTNVSIKNLNYSLMKLVAVQQQTQVINKGTVHQFMMIDRVPALFEVNATALPHPAKIQIRPDPNNNNNIPIDTLNSIMSEYLHVYLSTQTKNPNLRNNQLHLQPPIPKVFQFSPLGNPNTYMSQDGTIQLNRDQFDKIYIGFYYDLSNASFDEIHKQIQHLFNPEDKIDQQKIQDLVAQVNMQLMVKFPKDKEEIQKKRMAAMMKKLQATQGDSPEDMSGDQGEQKLKEINMQLTRYYQQQKTLIFEAEQQKQLKASQYIRKTSDGSQGDTKIKFATSGSISTMRINSPSVKINTSSKLTTDLKKQLQSHTQSNFYGKKPQAYNFLSQEATSLIRYNQLLDMYALQVNMQPDKTIQKIEQYHSDDIPGDNESDEQDFQTQVSKQYGINESNLKTQTDKLLGPIDHIARNAFVSSKYRQIKGIRSHLNHDITATRIQNSQNKAEINELQRRLKSQQWLNKWDDFRVQKSEYVAKALAILKYRRRIKNIITIIVLHKFVKGIIENYGLIKEFNMKKFTEFMIAIRMYVRFQKKMKQRYGEHFDHRLKNNIRINTTFMANSIKKQTEKRASKIIVLILKRKLEKQTISNKFEQYYSRIKFIQQSIIEIKQISQIKDHMGIMRILYSLMVLRHFFMSQPSKNKMAHRIYTRLQQCFDQVSNEIRQKKVFDEKKEHPDNSEQEIEDILPQLIQHMKIYDQINQLKYKLRIMENVQHQYGLLLKYLEQEHQSNNSGAAPDNFDQVRNCMIDTFQRHKEMAKIVTSHEEELYGVQEDQLNQPSVINKKEKKNESKEYDLEKSYRYLNQILNDTDDEVFEQLYYAATQLKQKEQDDLHEDMNLDDIEDAKQIPVEKKPTKKKSKDKIENSIHDILANEDHQQKLRNDRKNSIKLIQYYHSRPEKKMLYGSLNQIQSSKYEHYDIAFNTYNGTRSRKLFDKERIFILNEDDHNKYKFLDQFKDEVIDKGFDFIGLYQRKYKKQDLFKIIFKVFKMHESMTIVEKDKKADKGGKDNFEETRNSKKKSNEN